MQDYQAAWIQISDLALSDLRDASDPLTTRSAQGDIKLGALLGFMGEDEIDEYLEEHLAWSEIYSEQEVKPDADKLRQ